MRLERWRYTVPLRLRSLFRRDRVEQELDDELRDHVDRLTASHVARGLSPSEARDAALRAMHGIEQRKEECRDMRHVRVVEDLMQDLRYAGRMFGRRPGLVVIAVLSLALGIGASTTIFGVADALMWKRLPVPNPEQLVYFREMVTPSRGQTDFPYGQFVQFRDGIPMFTAVSAINVIDRSNVSVGAPGGGPPPTDGDRVRVALVSGNYFEMMHVAASVGRALTPEDDRAPGGHPVAVVSHRYWERRLSGAADVIGRTLRINATSFAIVGVTPAGFSGDWVGRPVDIWVPTMMQAEVMIEVPGSLTRRNDYWLRIVGRLAPGASIQQAQQAAQGPYQRVLRDWEGPRPSEDALQEISRRRLAFEPAATGFSPQRDASAQPLRILMSIAVLVLIVACANVASLLLARSWERQREMAMRAAIGASAGRIARQIFTESLLLATTGGALGLLFAAWGTTVLGTMLATGPVQMFFAASSWIAFDVHLDATACAFAAGVTLLAGIACGLAPAARGSATSLSRAPGGRGITFGDSAGGLSLGRMLIVAQVALGLIALITAGLFVRSVRNLQTHDLGFEREHLLLVWTQPSATGRKGGQLTELWSKVHERLSSLPGVVSASESNGAILNGVIPQPRRMMDGMRVEGQPPRPSNLPAWRTFVAPRFFETMGVPLLAGREFTERDTDTAPPVVVINETMARHYFGSDNPVGRHVGFAPGTDTPVEIVGVVKDFERGTPRAAGQPQLLTYFSYRDREAPPRLVVMCAVLRSAGDPRGLASQVRAELRDIDPALPVLAIDTIDEQLHDVLAPDRLMADLCAFFGVGVMLLACVGLYGLMAHATARRTSEFGVRLALGATREGLLFSVLKDSIRLVIAGAAVGLPVAAATMRTIAERLFGVGAADPLTFAGGTVLMIGVAAIAALVPAFHAARVDPIVALRCE